MTTICSDVALHSSPCFESILEGMLLTVSCVSADETPRLITSWLCICLSPNVATDDKCINASEMRRRGRSRTSYVLWLEARSLSLVPGNMHFLLKHYPSMGSLGCLGRIPSIGKQRVNDETSLDSFGMLRLRQKNLGADSRISS